MSGIFASFNTAKSGMIAQQRAISTTSHNIANSATKGYSRQRVQIVTTRPISLPGQAGQIGTGAQVSAIERVRDTFLDYQIRGESSQLGKYQIKSDYLSQIESVFNEPSDTGISTLMSDFFDAFQELSKQSTSSSTRTVVAQKTATLCDALNATYNKLEKLKIDAQDSIKTNVKDINSLLDQLSRLNDEIRTVSVTGNTPNDLLDSRDLLIDELSYKFNISVEKADFNGFDIKAEDTNSIRISPLVNSNPNGEISRFSYVSSIVKDGDAHIITYYKNGDTSTEANKQTLRVTGLSDEQVKGIETTRVLWGDSTGQAIRSDGYPLKNGETINSTQLMLFTPKSGELNGAVEVQESINDYMNQLDKIAKTLALTVNAVHSGSTTVEGDELPFFVNGDTSKYDNNGLLILSSNDENSISAKNISINLEILTDVMKINTKSSENAGEGDGTRALAIAGLKNLLVRVSDVNESIISREDLFTKGGTNFDADGMTLTNNINGTKMESHFQDIIDKLGVQSQQSQRMVKNQEQLLSSLETNKLSVSGVSLDEEMSNLIQFQHAYNANAKMIATLDEMLDVIVNGLKR
jgi:flagellar hook-associated protein 1 FlgK